MLGIQPTLIYVDADHEEAAVLAHLLACHLLFPAAAIVGDDWPFGPVQKSAKYFSEITRRAIRNNDAAYCFEGIDDH